MRITEILSKETNLVKNGKIHFLNNKILTTKKIR